MAFLASWVKQGTPWKKIMFLLHQPKGQTIFLSNRQDHASFRNHHWSENRMNQQIALFIYIYMYIYIYLYLYADMFILFYGDPTSQLIPNGDLDLSDITTYWAVEAAVLYILQLMQGKETFFSGNGKSLAMRQWRQLRELLVAGNAQSCPAKRKASIKVPEVRKDKAARSRDKSAAVDGVYRPNERVRSLPAVYEAPDQVIMLKCSRCAERSSTSWLLKHPRNGRIYALVPLNGHRTCRKRLGKKCPWLSLDGTDTRLDDFEHLDFCDHKCRRSLCKDCGGRGICPHNRRWSMCQWCGGRGLCPHNRRKSRCSACKT